MRIELHGPNKVWEVTQSQECVAKQESEESYSCNGFVTNLNDEFAEIQENVGDVMESHCQHSGSVNAGIVWDCDG